MTGCTGGLGREVCFYLAEAGAELIMMDRNPKRSEALAGELTERFPELHITRIVCELEDMDSVRAATDALLLCRPDIFIANAGAYSIPRHPCSSGYENIFQINFVSPYYISRRLREELPSVHIIAVGSIAHTYSKLDPADIDFRTRRSSAKTYGNSKRYLMLALSELCKDTPPRLSIVHPGITFTNITAHYPKVIFAIIKYPMKLIFMKPKKAALCVIRGIECPTPFGSWIGPQIFGIWGRPRLQRLKVCFTEDRELAAEVGERIYQQLICD